MCALFAPVLDADLYSVIGHSPYCRNCNVFHLSIDISVLLGSCLRWKPEPTCSTVTGVRTPALSKMAVMPSFFASMPVRLEAGVHCCEVEASGEPSVVPVAATAEACRTPVFGAICRVLKLFERRWLIDCILGTGRKSSAGREDTNPFQDFNAQTCFPSDNSKVQDSPD